jgi:hypothetical protein
VAPKKTNAKKTQSKKIQAVAEWPGILNPAQEIVKKHVDAKGNGVFSFTKIFEGTQYQRQAPTICRYLQDLGILVKGRKTAGGAFNWTLKPRKVTVADVRKARAKRPHTDTFKNTRTRPKARKPRTAKITASTPDSPPIQASKKVPKKLPLTESLPMLLEVVETLRKENDELKSQIKELKARNLSDDVIADRVSKLICELTAPPKN